MNSTVSLLFRLSFLVCLFTLLQAPLNAKRVLPQDRVSSRDYKTSVLKKRKKQKLIKFSFRKKPRPKKYKNGAGPVWPSVLLWYVLIPLGIIGLFVAAFLMAPVSMLLWYIALAASVVWLAVSGIVFFPIQYVGLLGGMATILASLIYFNSIFVLTAGIALVLAAIFALSYMVLMFLIGTRKYQPKYK
jgi:cation transport ATPase